MKLKRAIITISLILLISLAFSLDNPYPENQEIKLRNSIGSTLFLVGNFAPGDPPNFYQLNYGYRLNQKTGKYQVRLSSRIKEALYSY